MRDEYESWLIAKAILNVLFAGVGVTLIVVACLRVKWFVDLKWFVAPPLTHAGCCV